MVVQQLVVARTIAVELLVVALIRTQKNKINKESRSCKSERFFVYSHMLYFIEMVEYFSKVCFSKIYLMKIGI